LKKNIFENYKKLQKTEKSKNKNGLFYFIVSVRSLAPCDTYFLKNTKNSFISLLVSVRPLASWDTIFQIISKTPKKYKIFKIQKYQHFQAKSIF